LHAVEAAPRLPSSAFRCLFGVPRAHRERRKAKLSDTPKAPNSSALLRFFYLFDENDAAAVVFATTSAQRKRYARRCGGANARLYTKLSRTAVNFFPLVYFGCSADRFATALHR
jgi:hypothetical protein